MKICFIGKLDKPFIKDVINHINKTYKEVDIYDRADLRMTSFFDSKLYPEDRLSFRSAPEWEAFLKRLGVTDPSTLRLKHPWPASRTIISGHRESAAEMNGEFSQQNIWPEEGETVRVFVTGATGFIGGHLVRKLLAEGINGTRTSITILCRDPSRVPREELERLITQNCSQRASEEFCL